jgi:hypothetical protein
MYTNGYQIWLWDDAHPHLHAGIVEELHLAYRWFGRLDLDDKVPDHSTFSAIAMAAFATATSCATCSRLWFEHAWMQA